MNMLEPYILKMQSNPATCHEGAWGDRRYSSYSFSTSALDGGGWSASRPGRALPPGKGPPVPIVQEAGWAPEPVWMQGLEEKFSASFGDRTPNVQSVVRHYTDWATPAPTVCIIPTTNWRRYCITFEPHLSTQRLFVKVKMNISRDCWFEEGFETLATSISGPYSTRVQYKWTKSEHRWHGSAEAKIQDALLSLRLQMSSSRCADHFNTGETYAERRMDLTLNSINETFPCLVSFVVLAY
jgi:hypothetical protein